MLTFIRAKISSLALFFYSHRRWCVGITLFVLIVAIGSLAILEPAKADIFHWPEFGDTLIRTIAKLLLSLARLLLKISIFIVSFILEVAAYNGYLSSAPVNIGWSVVLNLTNMFFVVILLIIAFATILGIEQYEWKKLLPKFFFAAVLINFSRTVCGVLIDASQVFMNAFVNAAGATAGALYINGFGLDKLEKFQENVQPESLVATGIFTASIAAVFFAALITCAFGAYLFILAGRLIRLWILIILSPLAFALSVLPRTQSMASQWWSELGDNLVTGPVLMFFMWLSLVVAGSGNIAAHISEKSNRPGDQKIAHNTSNPIDGTFQTQAERDKAAAQSAGLTDILQWSNMANFIIAIGLLFAGAQVASRIGGSSGNLMAAGLNFGKRVATIATGVAAGQWLYGKVAGGARSAAGSVGNYLYDRAPIVGKNSFARRLATSVGGRFSKLGGKLEEYQNKKAADLEKQAAEYAKQGGVRGTLASWGARVRASAWESGARKMAIAENWKEDAAAQWEIVEKTFSTSGTKSGQAKLDTQVRLDRVKEVGESAGKVKRAEKEAEIEKRIEKTLKEKGVEGLSWDDRQYYDRTNKMLQNQAKTEQIKKELGEKQSRAVAEARDKYLEEKRGVGGGFLDQELAKQSKDAQDRAGVASFDKSMAKVGLINEKIKQAIKDGNHALVETLQKELNHLAVANLNRGSLFGVSGEGTALASGGRWEGDKWVPLTGRNVGAELNDENLRNAQANFLATKLGRDVETKPEKITEAVRELEEKMGSAYMEQMTDALNKMAEDGASTYAGLFRGEMVNGEYKIRATNLEQDKSHIEGKREWAVSQSKFNRISGFDASADNEWDAESKSMKVRIHSETALNNLSKIFGSLNFNHLANIDQNNIDTLARAMKNAESGDEIKKILDTIKQASSVADGQKDSLIHALEERISKSVALEGQKLEDLKKKIASAAGSGGGSASGGGSRDPNVRPKSS